MTKQQEFIHNEIWTLTFGAAFQRANLYSNYATDRGKENLKKTIRKFIESKLKKEYTRKTPSEARHLKNIQLLSLKTRRYRTILQNGKLNFGISQKILNLYLKYCWCLKEIKTPPHFPVDRRIQEDLKIYPIISWTKMNNVNDYLWIINAVREKLSPRQSLAEYELINFKRRLQTK